jgi:hypothetical protein
VITILGVSPPRSKSIVAVVGVWSKAVMLTTSALDRIYWMSAPNAQWSVGVHFMLSE